MPTENIVQLRECEGHPAGPFDPMGETVYCDGTCASGRIFADLDRALDLLDIERETARDAMRPAQAIITPIRPEADDADDPGFMERYAPSRVLSFSIGVSEYRADARCGICDRWFDAELAPMLIGAEKWARICEACDIGMALILGAEAVMWAGAR